MLHRLAPMGITTAELGLGLPGAASLYEGWMQTRYFGDPSDVLGNVWMNSLLAPPTAANPMPLQSGGVLRIPVLASLPGLGPAPDDGWPVVLFQHGVTSNRTSMIAIADAFAHPRRRGGARRPRDCTDAHSGAVRHARRPRPHRAALAARPPLDRPRKPGPGGVARRLARRLVRVRGLRLQSQRR